MRSLRKLAHEALGDPDGINADPTVLQVVVEEDDDLIEDEDSLGIFEWSAPPGCSIGDRDGWAQANPSLGYSITEKAIASAARTDPEWVFRTEVLCQWSEGTLDGLFPTGVWEVRLRLGVWIMILSDGRSRLSRWVLIRRGIVLQRMWRLLLSVKMVWFMSS